MKQTAVEWLEYHLIGIYESDYFTLLLEKAKAMEEDERQMLLNYIQEVHDLCIKLRFPTEEELSDLAFKSDVILKQFKKEEQ